MTQTYVKDCIFCKEKIRMSDQKDGKWHAFNSDSSIHDCKKKNEKENGNGKESTTREARIATVIKMIQSVVKELEDIKEK